MQPADLFQALADPIRLRILRLIAKQEVCVCYFVEALAESQPKISRHLAYLRRSGVVQARREGKWMHYRIADLPNSHAEAVLRAALAWTGETPAAKRDQERFEFACCQPQKFVTLLRAPVPAGAGTERDRERPFTPSDAL
jgi:ArsR family transcriptional regulator